MMTRAHRRNVWILIAVLFVGSAVMSEVVRPGHDEYLRAGRAVNPSDPRAVAWQKGMLAGTSFEAMLPTVFGVREVVASLMWIQADDYFHRGEYRPIINLVRQITAIDPHQIDVYATGAWHMAYNFMDKRLIEDGVRFLEEGCKNNDSIYDLHFELGYMHQDKTKDYPKAVEALRIASQRGRTTGERVAPSYVRHQLAHAMERMGDIDACVEQWKLNLATAEELGRQGATESGAAGTAISAAHHNLYLTQRRRNERLAALAERAGSGDEARRLWQANVDLANAWLQRVPRHTAVTADLGVAEGHVERLSAGRLNKLYPNHVKIAFTVKRVQRRQLLVEGTINVLTQSRIHIRFHDRDYDARSRNFDFKMSNCTLEYDNVSIKDGGRFKWLIDLNRDPADMDRPPETVYPLKADEYEITLTYNPRTQAPFIQDRYGWHGEGLTADPGRLMVDRSRAGKSLGKAIPLQLVHHAGTRIRREQIEADGEKLLFASRG